MTRRLPSPRRLAAATALGAALALAGCASTHSTAPPGPGAAASGVLPSNPVDPLESWNRKVFSFNEGLDEHVMVPVATAYQTVVPRLVRRGVTNVYNNFADAWSVVNALLQGKVDVGMQDLMRFLFNTTFGFAGALDIASEMGLRPHYEDLGQTLGTWGFGAGPYVVWPLLGPSSVRDSVALPFDRAMAPSLVIHETSVQVVAAGLNVVNARANLLGASRVLDDIALDKYSFVRDAYLARRRNLVYDGNPPDDALDDEERYDMPESSAPAPANPASGVPPPAPAPAPEGAAPPADVPAPVAPEPTVPAAPASGVSL